MRCILHCFEAVSSLNINLAKSKMFCVGEILNIKNLAWILGCKIGILRSTYLGLSLEAKFKSKAAWEPVMERISLKLESRKVVLLSKGGRLTLLKSTLASIPNYYLSLLTISGLVATRMESYFSKFLWNDKDKHHRYHLVDWNIIVKLLNCGGLGMRSIRDQNRALLSKWLWRFGIEIGSLWCRVVVARFRELSE